MNEFFEQLSFNFEQLEKKVSSRPGSYCGLEKEALLTDFTDYLNIFRRFDHPNSYVEFGSAYGHGPLIFSYLFPHANAVGIEFEEVRYATSLELKNNLNLQNCDFILADLALATIPAAHLYFLYFPTGPILDRILSELSSMNHSFHLIVIESHSDLIPRIEKETWLTQAFEVPLITPRHYSKAKIYSSGGVRSFNYFHYSFIEKYFLITGTDDAIWVGDSLGLEWHSKDQITLFNPPFTIQEDQIQNVVEYDSFDLSVKELIKLRLNGPVEFLAHKNRYQGFIRKIYLRPEIQFELSSGERFKYAEISQIASI